MYKDEDIPLPSVNIKQEDQDPHSKRLMKVIDIWDNPMSEEAIRRARRAYYGNCSYVDANVGKLLQVLEECDLIDDTIIIFFGDHGDFLGERGLWYKMSFLEPSARVPFLIYAPKYFSPRRVSESISTVDLLPTLVELAGGQLQPDLEMDGRSLLPHLSGVGNKHDEVIGEYTAEGTLAPLMMIRRSIYKFIYCPVDPPQLFNIKNDPYELVNLAQSTSEEHMQILAQFMKEAQERWDISTITSQVLRSQRQRRFTDAALRIGQWKSWDHQPFKDSSKQYIRSVAANLDDLEYLARFPRTAELPPSAAKIAHES
jgi:choline-sulfatase